MTAWVLDLDGVIWLGEYPIPGAGDAIARLRAAGHEVAFCTNNSSEPIARYEERLAGFGIEASGAVISSASAAASLLASGDRALVCAGPGVVEALQQVGVTTTLAAHVVDGTAEWRDDDRVDAVVVGFHRNFDYAAMKLAMRAVLAGARLVATNDDPIYPSGDGPAPGCGSILASIERASGCSAEVAGKPNEPMAALLRARFGGAATGSTGAAETDPREGVLPPAVFVGDSLGTDGAMAARLGWPFGLVMTGNCGPGDVPPHHPPEWVADDLAALVDRFLAASEQ